MHPHSRALLFAAGFYVFVFALGLSLDAIEPLAFHVGILIGMAFTGLFGQPLLRRISQRRKEPTPEWMSIALAFVGFVLTPLGVSYAIGFLAGSVAYDALRMALRPPTGRDDHRAADDQG